MVSLCFRTIIRANERNSHSKIDMNKKFSLNLVFLLALNVLVKPFYLFGIEVGVQNAVGAEDYGLYYAMFNFTFLFNVLLDLGINNYQKIKVAQHAESGMQNMSNLIPIKLTMALVYMVVTVIVALFFGFEKKYWFFIGWLMLNHVLSTYLLLIRANLSGLQLFVRDSILSVIDRLVLIFGIGYLLFYNAQTFQIEWFVMFQTASYVLAILVGLIFTPANHRFFKLDFSRKAAWKMVKQTWPFALLILLMTAYHKLDGIMLERLAPNGLLEAGIYAQAFRILDAGNNFAFLYAGLLLPMFAKLFVDDFSAIPKLVDQAARFLIIPAGVVFIITLFHAKWLMQLLYDAHIATSATSLQWLMGSFVWMAVSYVYSTLITASAKMKLLNWVAFGTVILNVVLNAIFIPKQGAIGAAMASFISLGFMALSQILVCYQRYSELDLKWLVPTTLVWCAAFGTETLLQIVGLEEWISIVVSAAVSISVFTISAVDFAEIKSTFLSKSGQ